MNFTVVSGGTAQPLASTGPGPLRTRILSALVMFPVVVAAVVSGTPYFEILVIAAALAMSWEWTRICGDGHIELHGYLSMAITLLALGAAALGNFDLALVITVTGAAAVLYAARDAHGVQAPWTAAGVLAIAIPVISLIWIAALPTAGWKAIMWLFGAVWVTDIAAYGFGRWIGGARLAPRISPGKTWAGLYGGIACAALWSVAWGWWFGAPSLLWLMVIGASTAVFAQAGDLGVSKVKRRFGVKNASGLIPGHGGVLDRADGVMGAAPVLAIMLFLTEGNEAQWLGL